MIEMKICNNCTFQDVPGIRFNEGDVGNYLLLYWLLTAWLANGLGDCHTVFYCTIFVNVINRFKKKDVCIWISLPNFNTYTLQ